MTSRASMASTSSHAAYVMSNCSSTSNYTIYGAQTVVFLTYYYGLLGLLTVVNLAGNAIVMMCILRHEQLRVPGNYFIISLACSDFCLGLVYPVYNVSHIELPEVSVILGDRLSCTSVITIYLGLQMISAYSLVGLAVTRFISVRNPLRFSSLVTHLRALLGTISLWVILLPFSAALYLRLNPGELNNCVCRYEFFFKEGHILFTCIMSVIIPLLLMSILYGFMATEARKHVIAIACVNSALLGDSVATRRYIIKKELRMVAMAGTLLGYFAFAWIPFVVYQFYTINQCREAMSDGWTDCEPNRYIRATVRLLLHSNSAVNFFIYSARVKDFREAFRKDLRTLFCCSRTSREEQPLNTMQAADESPFQIEEITISRYTIFDFRISL